MPRVVPSDVVAALDRMFPEMAGNPTAFPNVGAEQVPSINAVVRLVEAVPEGLISLDPSRYAELLASTAYIRAMPDMFMATRGPIALPLRLRNFDRNPIAMIRAAMVACPDEAPASVTASLNFITDPDLRDSIRLDVSAANQDLAQGEWKGATVLAGSAVEALLLWALQQRPIQDITQARTNVTADRRLTRDPGADLERWLLPDYIEVAGELGIIKVGTVQQARLAKDFRNLIHPGRAIRLGQKCDRGTALSALAAVELVVRDLTP
jgi:hypothetical protein